MDEVRAEVYLSVQRFECDERGRSRPLEALANCLLPVERQPWRADHAHITRQGPASAPTPRAPLARLSQALADLSRQIAAAVQSVYQPKRI